MLSGHETFPLRHGWLKKAFDAVRGTEEVGDNRWIFTRDDSIARFGVGKNMVASMRHWALVADVIEEVPGERRTTSTLLGRLLLDKDNGVDPYLEMPASNWIVHWNIAGRAAKTTWFWAFSHLIAPQFDREALVRGIQSLSDELGWHRASMSTIRRDVACFLRTYLNARQEGYEEAIESPLSDLELIKPAGYRDGLRFARGPKPTLGTGVFAYAVTEFWKRMSNNANVLAFETLAYEPGSPGRVFLLDEASLIDHLIRMEKFTGGVYDWSEAAGLRQLVRKQEVSHEHALRFVSNDYGAASI